MRKGTALWDLLGDIYWVDSHPEAGWALNTSWYVRPDGNPNGPLQPRLPRQTGSITDSDLCAKPFFRPFNDALLTDPQQGSSEAARPEIRAEVLGTGIPALSQPTGSNPLDIFGDRNIDLTLLQTGWPAERSTSGWSFRWLHSDLKDVAYPFNHMLYDQLRIIGGLDQ
jgi:hypothetical protein